MKRMLSLAGWSVGALFLLITLISSFLPRHVRVSRAIDIQYPSDSVQAVLKSAAYWETVLPEGTSFRIQSQSDSSFHCVINSKSAIQMAAGYQVFVGTAGSSCSVQRYYDFYFDWYPWEKFSSLLVEAKFGLALENELQQLKKRLAP
ncbi:hypothetical protein LBMAG22_04200 [Bacteroidota bacterium]|nr:hypothetical protein LBMAG22_04200 [Bacteroidota bacterium]